MSPGSPHVAPEGGRLPGRRLSDGSRHPRLARSDHADGRSGSVRSDGGDHHGHRASRRARIARGHGRRHGGRAGPTAGTAPHGSARSGEVHRARPAGPHVGRARRAGVPGRRRRDRTAPTFRAGVGPARPEGALPAAGRDPGHRDGGGREAVRRGAGRALRRRRPPRRRRLARPARAAGGRRPGSAVVPGPRASRAARPRDPRCAGRAPRRQDHRGRRAGAGRPGAAGSRTARSAARAPAPRAARRHGRQPVPRRRAARRPAAPGATRGDRRRGRRPGRRPRRPHLGPGERARPPRPARPRRPGPPTTVGRLGASIEHRAARRGGRDLGHRSDRRCGVRGLGRDRGLERRRRARLPARSLPRRDPRRPGAAAAQAAPRGVRITAEGDRRHLHGDPPA